MATTIRQLDPITAINEIAKRMKPRMQPSEIIWRMMDAPDGFVALLQKLGKTDEVHQISMGARPAHAVMQRVIALTASGFIGRSTQDQDDALRLFSSDWARAEKLYDQPIYLTATESPEYLAKLESCLRGAGFYPRSRAR